LLFGWPKEVAHPQANAPAALYPQAHFPFFKTIDEFDFSLQTTLRQSLLGLLLGIGFRH